MMREVAYGGFESVLALDPPRLRRLPRGTESVQSLLPFMESPSAHLFCRGCDVDQSTTAADRPFSFLNKAVPHQWYVPFPEPHADVSPPPLSAPPLTLPPLTPVPLSPPPLTPPPLTPPQLSSPQLSPPRAHHHFL